MDTNEPTTIPAESTGAYEPYEPESQWPKVLGIISLIYAILGMGCALFMPLGVLIQKMMVADSDIEFPTELLAWQILYPTVGFILGIYLLVGAFGLLNRRPVGVKRVRRWAMIRLVWAVISLGAGLALAEKNVDFAVAMNEAQQERVRQSAPNAPTYTMDRETTRMMTYGSAIGFAVIATMYPLFLTFFLTRDAVGQEVERWDVA